MAGHTTNWTKNQWYWLDWSKCKIILWIFSDLIISQLYHKFSHDIRPQQTTSVGSNRVITSYVYQLRFYSINVTDESWIWESHFLIISYQVFKFAMILGGNKNRNIRKADQAGKKILLRKQEEKKAERKSLMLWIHILDIDKMFVLFAMFFRFVNFLFCCCCVYQHLFTSY